MERKVKSQVKAHFFNPTDPISIIAFPFTLKLACDTNRIHEVAAMWVLSLSVKNALATTLNSRMSAVTHIAFVVALVTPVKLTTQKKHLCSYPEVANYLHKKFANN